MASSAWRLYVTARRFNWRCSRSADDLTETQQPSESHALPPPFPPPLQDHCLRLPGTLLTHVLGCVPQQQRLQHAAAVCSAFASGAAAATVSVDIDSLQSKDAPSFQAWIDRHAQQLVSISVKTPDWNEHKMDSLPLSLPVVGLQQLHSLDLAGFEVLLPGSPQDGSSSVGDSGSGSTASTSTSSSESPDSLLPKLRGLRLDMCVLRTPAVLQVGQLSGLTRLQLRNLGQDHLLLQERRMHGSWQHQLDVAAAVKRILQRSPQLVCLELACWNEAVIAQTGLLSSFAAHFPSSLTALRVGDQLGSVLAGRKGPDLACSISTLTNLQGLAACHVAVCPTALAGLAQLRDLKLHHFTFLPPQPTTPGAAVGASALLSSLSGMRKLQHLSVISEQNALADAQASEFATLTASSQLPCLQVTAVEEQPLLAAALQHMFPAGKQLPLLQHVSLTCDEAGAEAGHCTGADLRSMFSACRGLCSLDVTGLLHPDIDFDAWLDLPPTCCSLRVGGEELGDAFAGVMARLTHLTCLHWNNSPELTDAGVCRAVTAATRCTCLPCDLTVLLVALLAMLATGSCSCRVHWPGWGVQGGLQASGRAS